MITTLIPVRYQCASVEHWNTCGYFNLVQLGIVLLTYNYKGAVTVLRLAEHTMYADVRGDGAVRST